jgi:hypothetical protein
MIRKVSILACALLIALSGISAADGLDVQRHARVKKPKVYLNRVPYALFVPDCLEGYDAEVLLCAPRVRLYRPYDLRVLTPMRTILVRARPPYPQAFTYAR